MKKQGSFLEKAMAGSAKSLAEKNVNSACWYWLHQPEIPAKVAEKLKEK